MPAAILDLQPFELPDWMPAGENLPPWLADLRAKHLAATDNYTQTIRGLADASAASEVANRQHRRAVRDAISAPQPIAAATARRPAR